MTQSYLATNFIERSFTSGETPYYISNYMDTVGSGIAELKCFLQLVNTSNRGHRATFGTHFCYLMSTNRASSRRSISTDSRMLIGIMADLETTIGFLLAGIGEVSGPELDKNFMVVNEDTPVPDMENFFAYLCNRKNLGVIFVASYIIPHLAQVIPHVVKTIPIILEIPTKDTIVHEMEHKQRALKKMKMKKIE